MCGWLTANMLVVGDYTGLRSFHELHPVLGCGALTGLGRRRSRQCRMKNAELACGWTGGARQ